MRTTDHNSSTGILQVHSHSRNSNTKYFTGYMLFLEELLEARATVWLFACLISSSPIQQIYPTSGRWQNKRLLEQGILGLEVKQMQNTPPWGLIAMFSSTHLVYSLSESPQKAKRRSLLSPNKITRAYLYMLWYMSKTETRSPYLLVHLKTTKQELVHNFSGVLF